MKPAGHLARSASGSTCRSQALHAVCSLAYSTRLSPSNVHNSPRLASASKVGGQARSLSRGPLSPPTPVYSTSCQLPPRARVRTHVAAQAQELGPLGLDILAFLISTVTVIPLFKKLKLSPILGFLASGVFLQEFGFVNDLDAMKELSEFGVLFLLFEMGLELSIDRLKALAKYAFGIGSLQMLICTGMFTLFALPPGHSMGTQLLIQLAGAPAELVSIHNVVEAVVVGAALSLSSSAFVLQLLSERGETTSRFGSATLGVLLFQDIAIIPFLVLLPLLESDLIQEGSTPMGVMQQLGPTAFLTVAGLGGLLLTGRVILRRVFSVVAESKNLETFVAMCLFTVAGTSMLTQSLGFSSTLGAFIAGVLLSETNFRTQVETDIKPFRGLLLGLFFVTTGTSIDLQILSENWALVAWMLAGLLSIKTGVTAFLGRGFGLSGNEALRLGFTLSQGGEFAFVLLSLASDLRVLPEDLNQILIIVVVMSMALTPALAEFGKVTADNLDTLRARFLPQASSFDEEMLSTMPYASTIVSAQSRKPVIICGFSLQAQMLANMLESPLTGSQFGQPYVAFDLDPFRVQLAREAGFTAIFGDGSNRTALVMAGINMPQVVAVCHTNRETSLDAVRNLRSWVDPSVKIYACGRDLKHAAQLEEAGADSVVLAPTEAGLELGAEVLEGLGLFDDDVDVLKMQVGKALVMQTQEMAENPLLASNVELLIVDKERHKPPLLPPPTSPNGSGKLDQPTESPADVKAPAAPAKVDAATVAPKSIRGRL